MKKIVLYIIIIILIYIIVGNIIIDDNVIPQDAIRIRVIANSNSVEDQNIKIKVKDKLQNEMYNLLKNVESSDKAKTIINANLKNIEKTVYNALQENNSSLDYNINFGLNYFPKKEYKGIKYEDGYYESLVVTLGEGLGDNWWCVLFPPLCLIEAEESTDVEYTTIVKELISKYY